MVLVVVNVQGAAFYSGDALVGAVCCRLEKANGKACIYIMTLGVLAPYRDLGIGEACSRA